MVPVNTLFNRLSLSTHEIQYVVGLIHLLEAYSTICYGFTSDSARIEYFYFDLVLECFLSAPSNLDMADSKRHPGLSVIGQGL